MTAWRTVDPAHPDPEAVAETVRALRNGDLVILPTETVYGLAADARVPGAVEKIYRAKQRPPEKEIALLISRDAWENVPALAGNALARRLGQAFWPGPLTLVVPEDDAWMGYRVPDHPAIEAVLRAVARPLTVSSANLSGRPSPRTADDAARDLADHVAVILDAGPAPGGVPSTVVRVHPDHVEILRPGALTEDQITRAAGLDH